MGQIKKLLQDAIERGYAYSTDNDLPEWRSPVSQQHAEHYDLLRRERNAAWHEDMPDLSGQALAEVEAEWREVDQRDEADNMPLWIQLELDLWENRMGLGGDCNL